MDGGPRGEPFAVTGDHNLIIAGNAYGDVYATGQSYDHFCGGWYERSSFGADELFVGRDSLFDSVDMFLATRTSGFFLLVSNAGLGKTAFATRLAHVRGYHLHVVDPSDRAMTLRKHLAALLIRQWNLTGLLQGNALPPGAGRAEWFADVLSAAAARRDAEQPGQDIVLVVDGLDELPTGNLDFRLGFPGTLPDGVYVVLTCRTGSEVLDHWADARRELIRAESDDNMFDMRQMLEKVVGTGVLAPLVARHQKDPEEVIETLLNRCAGVWIYLRFVLAGLAAGQLSLAELERLPPNLWDYYAETIRRWRLAGERWHSVGLPVLAALAASRAGLSADILASIVGSGRTSEIEAFLTGPLRAFCHVELSTTGNVYRLYHGSLRYFISGAKGSSYLLGGDFPAPADALSPLREELRTEAARSHRGMVEYYLDRWGGLHTDLRKLAERDRFDEIDKYGLENLIWHLEHATRFDDIDRLMSGRRHDDREVLPPAALPVVWLRAHQRAGLLDSYAEHVEWAMKYAMSRMGPPERFSISAATLAIRYAILLASLNSMASAISPTAVAALVHSKFWSPKNGISHASRIAEPLLRAETFLRLAHASSGAERSAAVQGAFEALKEAGDTPRRCMVLLGLIPLLPPHLVAASIPIATRITVPGQRVGVLVGLLLACPADRQQRSALDLFSRALASPDPRQMLDLLIAAAPFVPHAQAMLAGEYARALGDLYEFAPTAMALALATRLDPAERQELTHEAVLGVRCIVDRDKATQFFAQISCFLPYEAVLDLVQGAFRLEGAEQWNTVIGQLAAHAKDNSRELFGLVRRRAGSHEWQWVVDAYGHTLGRAEIDYLLAVARAGAPSNRPTALLSLVPFVPESERRQLAGGAGSGPVVEQTLLRGLANQREGAPDPESAREIRAVIQVASSIRDEGRAQRAIHALRAQHFTWTASSRPTAHYVEEIHNLTRNVSRTSRPLALEYLTQEAEALVAQLGVGAAARIGQDIYEVCSLLV
ncbi:hypothetical protein ACIA5C_45475 [Actinoplanes sp. NPDC051343]|uniref:hypothetical protein n=1 Tax=Actinoplanes sp. NPDC051343 TaxID=3363906 RepID=UPI0037BBDD90